MALRAMAAKLKRCRACGLMFEPWRFAQVACGPKCAVAVAQYNTRRKLAREKRAGRIAMRSRRDWVTIAQGAFNAYIRARDEHLPCISCGRSTDAKRNAGHFRSVGAAPQLRFDEQNCWSQCEHCNSYLSGNQLQYRAALIDRIGLVALERLENDNRIHRHDVDELKAVTATYRAKLRELRKGREAP